MHIFVSTVLHGKVMHKVGVEVVGMGALKLTGYLRDRMQQNNIQFDSLYTVRTLKEVCSLSFKGPKFGPTRPHNHKVASKGNFINENYGIQGNEHNYTQSIRGKFPALQQLPLFDSLNRISMP